MIKNPKYTIIVPTVSRVKEFQATLSTILMDKFDNLEILIQDNATTWGLEKYIKNINDKRIVINRTLERLPMADNWTSAIEKSTGEYIFIIGDDDGWYPGSMELVDQIFREVHNTDILNWKRDDFGWSDAPPCIRDTYISQFSIAINIVQPTNLLAALYAGTLNHELLPKIYSSFISRSILDAYKKQFGTYFIDPKNPDISTGIQGLYYAKKIVRLEGALSIIGTSGSSNGANSLVKPILFTDSSTENTGLHPELRDFGRLGHNAELSILNTLLLCRVVLEPTAKVTGYPLYFIKYLHNLPHSHRIEAGNYIIKKYLNIFDPHQVIILNNLIANSEKIIQPIFENPPLAQIVADEQGFTIIGNTLKLGFSDISKAAVFGSTLRKFYI